VFYLEEAPSSSLKMAPRLRNSSFRRPKHDGGRIVGNLEVISIAKLWRRSTSGCAVIRAEPATESVKFAYDCLKFLEIS
jgi:hypothetical protein